MTRRPLAALGILFSQVWHTGHRPDLPSLTNQDPSVILGDPDSPPLKIVLLGDSSVTAPGVHPLDDCWARRVAHQLAKDYHVNMVNVAVGGARASDALKYQVPAALAEGGDIALVCVGANDALRAVNVADFEQDLTEILTRLRGRFPAVGMSGLGDLGPLPRLPTVGAAWATVRSRSFDRAIARVCHRVGVPKTTAWGPMWEPFNDPNNDNGMYAGDLFHASGKGHALFGEAWWEVLEGLLADLEPALSERSGSFGSSK